MIGRSHKRSRIFRDPGGSKDIFHNSIGGYDFFNPNVCASVSRCESCSLLSNESNDGHLTLKEVETALRIFKGGSK